MILFYEASAAAQSAILIAAFMTLILSVAAMLFAYNRHKANCLLFMNTAVFVVVFLLLVHLADVFAKINDGKVYNKLLPLPMYALWGIVFCLALLPLYELLTLRRKDRTLSRNSVKQAIDTLPEAVCYFTPDGRVKLCNLQMYRLFRTLAQSDLQALSELTEALRDCDAHSGVIRLSEERQTFLFPDGKAWRYSQSAVTTRDGVTYTETVFFDMTALYEKNLELKRQTKQLKHIAADLKKLSENVLELTKEREILSAKTRLHDQMGAGLIAMRQALLGTRPPQETENAVRMLRKAVSAIKCDNEYPTERGELAELLKDAAAIGTAVEFSGSLPENGEVRRLFLIAMRECLTNSVRHADATLLQINIEQTEQTAYLHITDNGKPPEGKITPKGGLLNVLRHTEDLNGKMKIISSPAFMLTLTVPLKQEEIS